jgi:hypothetical protein
VLAASHLLCNLAAVDAAEIITRGTIWLALLCYLAATVGSARRDAASIRWPFHLWVLGCLSFLIHVAAAFHFYHHWSHVQAMEDTRRQTKELTGLDYHGGLWFNYAFGVVWVADCLAWCWDGSGFRARHRVWHLAVQAWFLFMIFNATVIFGRGVARPSGAALCLIAIVALIRMIRARSAP